MELVVTPHEMGELDRKTIEAGTPEALLIERAAGAVAWQARRMLGGTYARRVVVACGKGNNGNDGRVAARVMRGWGVRVVELDANGGLDRDTAAREIGRADLFVDAMFGTGFRGALEGDAAWLAENAGGADQVLAVDIPSGVDGSTGAVHGPVVRAHATVCFAYLKPGLLFEPGRSCAGDVEVVDIGVRARRLDRSAFTPGSDPPVRHPIAVGRGPRRSRRWRNRRARRAQVERGRDRRRRLGGHDRRTPPRRARGPARGRGHGRCGRSRARSRGPHRRR